MGCSLLNQFSPPLNLVLNLPNKLKENNKKIPTGLETKTFYLPPLNILFFLGESQDPSIS